MASVFMRHGSPLMVDYTPASAVTAGDVVVIGGRPHIAHTDIAASRLGAMAMEGGVYSGTADAAILIGTDVYWDEANEVVTDDAIGPYLGICVVAAAGASEILFLHCAGRPKTAAVAAANVDADSPVAITASQSGTTFHTSSAGVTGAIEYDLPAATPGLEFIFRIGSAQEIHIDPNGTETIALANGTQQAAGKHILADDVGGTCTLRCVVAGTWEHTASIGTWTAEA